MQIFLLRLEEHTGFNRSWSPCHCLLHIPIVAWHPRCIHHNFFGVERNGEYANNHVVFCDLDNKTSIITQPGTKLDQYLF